MLAQQEETGPATINIP